MTPLRSLLWLSPRPSLPGTLRVLSGQWRLRRFDLNGPVPCRQAMNQTCRVGLLDLASLPLLLPERAEAWMDAFPGVSWVALTSTPPARDSWVGQFVSAHCVDFHCHPLGSHRLGSVLGHLWGMAELRASLPQEASVIGDDLALLGDSPAMVRTRSALRRFAATPEPVLINGESGTGKESAARFVHRHSPMSHGPLITVNCAAIPASLTHSELFGHEKGSFTHALRARAGRIECAEGGSLLLSGIDELLPEQQSALLRFLATGEVERVGGDRSFTVSTRIIATSTDPLERQVSQGRFRSDVYYRLGGCSLHMPPLRERREDLPVLVDALFNDLGRTEARRPRLTEGAMRALYAHDWPGNLRELSNRVRRGVLMGQDQRLTEADLMLESAAGPGVPQSVLSLAEYRARAEQEALNSSLSFCHHNVSAAARLLKISRVSLYRLMARHGMTQGEGFRSTDEPS